MLFLGYEDFGPLFLVYTLYHKHYTQQLVDVEVRCQDVQHYLFICRHHSPDCLHTSMGRERQFTHTLREHFSGLLDHSQHRRPSAKRIKKQGTECEDPADIQGRGSAHKLRHYLTGYYPLGVKRHVNVARSRKTPSTDGTMLTMVHRFYLKCQSGAQLRSYEVENSAS